VQQLSSVPSAAPLLATNFALTATTAAATAAAALWVADERSVPFVSSPPKLQAWLLPLLDRTLKIKNEYKSLFTNKD